MLSVCAIISHIWLAVVFLVQFGCHWDKCLVEVGQGLIVSVPTGAIILKVSYRFNFSAGNFKVTQIQKTNWRASYMP